MQQSDNKEVFLKLIKLAISDGVVVDDGSINWKWVYELSVKHSISNLIAYAIDKLENKPSGQIISLFDNLRNLGIFRESKQHIETEIILSKMEERGVINMPMKGFITKNLYPSPDMRSMCDVDILIKEECMDAAEKIMQELKFPIREGGGREVVYKRPPMLSFELHRAFVSEKYHKVIFDYYKQIWNKVRLSDNKKFTYELSDEDFYIYMIVHIAKHYLNGGIGIRAILDVFVFLEQYKEALDREYIYDEFSKINLHVFSRHIEKLAYVWFGEEEHDDITYNMTDFIFSGGTYGTKLYSDAAYALRDSSGGGKSTFIRRFVNIVFLPYENMCELYPKLKKHPWMLIYYWIYRIVDKLLNKRERVKSAVKYTADKENVDCLKSHLEQVGLM